jgi:soluble lytic murein transglycosylase-like protein
LGVADARDPAQNLEGGTAYLRQMLDRYRDQPNRLERALAAYNAGPAPVDRHGGLPPYRETVDFVSRVARLLLRGKAAVTSSAALEPRR